MGLNIIGLRRRGFSDEDIEMIKETYRIYYLSGVNTSEAKEKIAAAYSGQPLINGILSFMEKSTRGIIRK
jgi:UDP-N-acetylglucosamine acyltransferase